MASSNSLTDLTIGNRISIITVNLNNSIGLERTISSVVNQNFCDFEYIIIDGARTEGRLNVIKRYNERLKFWISEPDKGIYDAMNKGLLKATGDYLLFLNSGDFLYDK